MVLVAPSILSADFTKLGEEIKKLTEAKADFIHVDVMDGHFVPNFTFGNFIVKQIRPLTEIPFDVHLMVTEPEKMVEMFADAGADIITIHIEASDNVVSILKKIKSLGKKAGISIKPNTPVDKILPFLEYLDLILVMTVEPGFGGQSFMNSQLSKIREIKKAIADRNIKIEVDGGIVPETAKLCIEAGADILVAGSYVFKTPDYKSNIKDLKA